MRRREEELLDLCERQYNLLKKEIWVICKRYGMFEWHEGIKKNTKKELICARFYYDDIRREGFLVVNTSCGGIKALFQEENGCFNLIKTEEDELDDIIVLMLSTVIGLVENPPLISAIEDFNDMERIMRKLERLPSISIYY